VSSATRRSELDDHQRPEFHEALLEAASFEDLPGKWQAAVLAADQNRPQFRVVSGDPRFPLGERFGLFRAAQSFR
jgi:hypothetical protein